MEYKDAVLHVMSGTGNTRRVARWMTEVIQSQGTTVTVRGVEQGPPDAHSETGEEHLVGLLLPAHAFTATWPMLRLAWRLPRGQRTHAFVAVTRAGTKFGPLRLPGMEGTAGYLLALILRLKGYRVRGVQGIDMPSNWIAFHPGFSPESAADIIAHAKPKTDRYIRSVLAGKRWFGSWICLLLGLLLLPVSAAYLLAGRFFLAKLFFANNRCTGCGMCAKNCPFGAVRIWGKKRPRPYWTFSCESCMRCMAYCPARAIEAGHSWAVILFFLVTMPIAYWLFEWLSPLAPWVGTLNHVAVHFFVQYVYFLLAILLTYLVFWVLIRIRWVNVLFTYTTLTRWYRRYHEPGTEVDDLRIDRKTSSEFRDSILPPPAR